MNSYSPVVQWDEVRLIFILRCIIVLQSQIIDFTNAFSQGYIPSGEPVFVKIPRGFKSDGYQHDIFVRLNKSLYGQSKKARLWYGFFLNSLLDCGLVVNKVDPCLFMSNTVIFVVYVFDFLSGKFPIWY